MLTRPFAIGLAVFLSGAVSVGFQVGWMKALAPILGQTAYAVSCVLVTFMVGLALGSAIAGFCLKKSARLRCRALRLCGQIQIVAVLLSGAISAVVFWLGPRFAEWLQGFETRLSFAAIFHLGVVMGFFLLPTVLMGALFPFFSAAAKSKSDLPWLYGVNTLGAACGALIVSFCPLEALRTHAAIALLSSLIIYAICRRSPFDIRYALASLEQKSCGRSIGASSGFFISVAIAGLSGFTSLSNEVTWTQVTSNILKGSDSSPGLTLAIVLFCLGLSAICSSHLVRHHSAERLVLFFYAITVASFSGAFLLGSGLSKGSGMAAAISILVMVTAVTAMGFIFPLSIALIDVARPARIAWLYSVNIAAGVVGSTITGYFLLRSVGTSGSFLINTALMGGFIVAVTIVYRRVLSVGLKTLVMSSVVLCVVAWLAFIDMARENKSDDKKMGVGMERILHAVILPFPDEAAQVEAMIEDLENGGVEITRFVSWDRQSPIFSKEGL